MPPRSRKCLASSKIDDSKGGVCGCGACWLLQLFKDEALLDQFKIACGGAEAFGRKSGGWLYEKSARKMDLWLDKVGARIPPTYQPERN